MEYRNNSTGSFAQWTKEEHAKMFMRLLSKRIRTAQKNITVARLAVENHGYYGIFTLPGSDRIHRVVFWLSQSKSYSKKELAESSSCWYQKPVVE